MAVMIMNGQTRQSLAALKAFAEKNPYSMDDLLDIYNKQAPPPGDVDGYWCEVPVGIKVVFTIELQAITLRHLSVSGSAGLPHPEVVRVIMDELGFGELEKCHVYEGPGGGRGSINIMERIK